MLLNWCHIVLAARGGSAINPETTRRMQDDAKEKTTTLDVLRRPATPKPRQVQSAKHPTCQLAGPTDTKQNKMAGLTETIAVA
ncbi:MAG: hypothetical protein ACKPKO_11755, partial [Candidatus Fonsibacter sp.]